MNIKLYSTKSASIMDAKLYITDFNFVIVMGDNVLDVPYGNILKFTEGDKELRKRKIDTNGANVYYIETEKNEIYFSLIDGNDIEFRADFKQKLTKARREEDKAQAEVERKERVAKREEKKQKAKEAVMTAGDFLIALVLLNIPFVNFACWFVWLRKEDTNLNKRNLVLAEIVLWLFLLIIGVILAFSFMASGKI